MTGSCNWKMSETYLNLRQGPPTNKKPYTQIKVIKKASSFMSHTYKNGDDEEKRHETRLEHS